MWRGGNTLAAAMAALVIMAVAPLGGRQAAAQESIVEAPLVDWSVARQIHHQIEQWVKEDKVARKATDRPALVSGVVGVRVSLRFGGLTLGIGDALAPTGRPEAAVDLRDLAAKATELALVRYRDARRRAMANPLDHEGKQLPPQRGPQDKIPLQVDLQVAHSLTDVTLADGADPKTIYFQFAAGHHGVRLVHPVKGTASYTWPATALASNMMPDSQITQAVAELGIEGADIVNVLPKVGRAGGPRFQRFDVIHLVRPFEGQPLTQLTRGNDVIPLQAVDMSSIEAIGRRLSGHLTHRILTEGRLAGSLAGTYHPTSDRFDPAEATHADCGLAAYALACRANYLAVVTPNSVDYHNTKEKVRSIVEYLRRELLTAKFTEGEPEARAVLLMTILEAKFLGDLRNDRDRLMRTMQDYSLDKGEFLHPISRKPLSAEGQALMSFALGALYEDTRDEKIATLVYTTQAALWLAPHDNAEIVSIMPWMAATAARMQRLNPAKTDADKKAWALRVAAIQKLRENLSEKKLIRKTPLLGPADVVGGYDLINEIGQGAPTPDWRTSYPLWLIGWTLSQPEVLGQANANEMKIDAALSVRFLAQLMFDEPSCFYVRGARKEAMDGVRLALWDNRLAVKPNAMALIAITQLQRAIKGEN
ncbi:MAG: hypothetical protein WD768_15165 [Phycisphaeraceae bacterium]